MCACMRDQAGAGWAGRQAAPLIAVHEHDHGTLLLFESMQQDAGQQGEAVKCMHNVQAKATA